MCVVFMLRIMCMCVLCVLLNCSKMFGLVELLYVVIGDGVEYGVVFVNGIGVVDGECGMGLCVLCDQCWQIVLQVFVLVEEYWYDGDVLCVVCGQVVDGVWQIGCYQFKKGEVCVDVGLLCS